MTFPLELLKTTRSPLPVVAFPDFAKPFIVYADASSVAIGAVLSQNEEDGKYHPIYFGSRTMRVAQRNYTT